MTPNFTVARRGTDTSGRSLLATAFFWFVWCRVLADPRLTGFRTRIITVQGAFMSRLGGGASASAGYHDLAGCWDVRTWNLTAVEQQLLWDVAAEYGIWFWKRDLAPAHGGMDDHGHAIAGWDRPLASGAAYQWTQAKNRRNGLANNGPDYMHRAHPIVLYPPTQLLQEDYMTTDAAQAKLDAILKGQRELAKDLDMFRTAEAKRDRAAAQKAKKSKADLVARLGGIVDQLTEISQAATDDATKAQVRTIRGLLLQALADDPDVDGADNPVVEP